MNSKIAIIVALSCAEIFASSINYDLLGRKGSKMNSPMVYKNIDYSKTKKDKQQFTQSLKSQHLAKIGLPNNVAAIKGIYNNQGNMVGFAQDHYYHLEIKYTNQNTNPKIATSSGFYGRYGIANNANEAFIPIAINNYFNAATYQEHGSKYIAGVKQYEESPLTYANSSGYSVSTQNYSFSNPVQDASPYEYNKQITYLNLENVRDNSTHSHRSYIINWYYGNPPYSYPPYATSYDWNDVGVYMASEARPVKLEPNDQVNYVRYSPTTSFKTMPGHEMIAAKTYKILKNSSKSSVIFVGTNYPETPSEETPQIYMGLHTRKGVNGNSSASRMYSNTAKLLDNYIYENRTTEIVAAGNFSTKVNANNPNGTGYFAAEAAAANAITVGAVDASTKTLTNYSSKYIPRYCPNGIGNCPNGSGSNQGPTKPEILNFTHMFIPNAALSNGTNLKGSRRTYTKNSSSNLVYKPLFDGAEVSAAYTAGMVSDLLNTNPFYRWHPEAVKAALITSSRISSNPSYKIPTYKCLVTLNQSGSYNSNYSNASFCGHETRYWVGDINSIMTTSGSQKEIRFSVKRPANKTHFVAAIAWLSSGNDIANFGKIPQTFALEATANNTGDLSMSTSLIWHSSNSTSDNENYGVIEFNSSYDYLIFRIRLVSEDSRSENVGQMVLGFDVASY